MTLEELVKEYLATRSPGWLVLGEAEAMSNAIRAARFYAGYGPITALAQSKKKPVPGATFEDIGKNVELTLGEWSIVEPLFVLYLEFENSQRLEASRASGLEPYGRTVAEVQADITLFQQDMHGKAFIQPVVILGLNGSDELPTTSTKVGYPAT